ncbi:MAG: cation:proton antiporter domain-containing protein [Methylobacter sp.]
MNNGVAVVLFTIFAASAIERDEVSVAAAGTIFIQEILGGAALGLTGWMLIQLPDVAFGILQHWSSHHIGAVTSMYGVALHLDISGPIATVIAGLLSSNITVPRMNEDMSAFTHLLDGAGQRSQCFIVHFRRFPCHHDQSLWRRADSAL